MNHILEFTDVSRQYRRGVPVLESISFSLNPGEVVGLLGRNGAGKTTLVNLAIGLLRPDKGEVRVFGLSPTRDPVKVKERVGFVSEDGVVRGGATIGEVLSFHRKIFPQWNDALQRDLLDRFQLSGRAKVSRLSKGQQRQVALFCALCHRPELLLLDEPAGGLDPAARREFLETSIQALNRDGTTILFSSHHMPDVERIGERVILLHENKVALDASLDRVRERTCIAIVPRTSVSDPSSLSRLPGILRVRAFLNAFHVVVEGTPDEAHSRMKAALGQNGIRCVQVPLEELFIEMVGAERKETS